MAGVWKRINPARLILLPHHSSVVSPARSFSVFKAIGHDREAGSCLIYPKSTYSLVQETKMNPDPPRTHQTPWGFGWLVGFLPGSVWSQSGSAVNIQCCGPPGPHRLRTICSKVSAPVKRCTEQRWLPQIRSGGSSTALSVVHTARDTKQFQFLAVFVYEQAVNARACVWACDTQFWCLHSLSQEV